jgi:hypothetical protein
MVRFNRRGDIVSILKKKACENTKTARDYRQMVLAKTGTKPEPELVKDFLGRYFTTEAFVESLSCGE